MPRKIGQSLRSRTVRVDLRKAGEGPVAAVWGTAVTPKLGDMIGDWLARHWRDVHNPLLPDLLGTGRLVAAVLSECDAERVVFLLPDRFGVEFARLIAAVVSIVAMKRIVEVDGSGRWSIQPTGIARPFRIEMSSGDRGSSSRPWQDLAREGQASEALLAAPHPSSVGETLLLCSALLSLKAKLEARALARRVSSWGHTEPTGLDLAKARRVEILASRAMGDLEALPAIWRSIRVPDTNDAMAAAWVFFDRAVAGSFDAVRTGCLEDLQRAQALAGGRLVALDAACHLWSAAYHFHSSNDVLALNALRAALRALAAERSILRALPVSLRLAHLECRMGESETALARLQGLASDSIIYGELRLADEAEFTRCVMLRRHGRDCRRPSWRSDQATLFSSFLMLLDQAPDALPSTTGALDNRLLADVAVAALLGARPASEAPRWRSALAQTAERLGAEDRLRLRDWLP